MTVFFSNSFVHLKKEIKARSTLEVEEICIGLISWVLEGVLAIIVRRRDISYRIVQLLERRERRRRKLQ